MQKEETETYDQGKAIIEIEVYVVELIANRTRCSDEFL